MRKILAGLVSAGMALTLTACGSEEIPADSVYANMGVTIGIAMPTTTSARWIADGDAMTEQFRDMGYKVNLQYAEDKADIQVAQVKSMIDAGNKLLVIAAVENDSMGEVLKEAKAKGVEVIAYDRLLVDTPDVGYQATFDNVRVGQMQAQLLVERLKLDADDGETYNVELFAGSATDTNAESFWKGGFGVLKPYIRSGKIKVRSNERKFAQTATDRYSGEIAGERMARILEEDYQNEIVDGVLSPYDGMTIGIIDALKEAGYTKDSDDKPLPVTSGQDAELPSVLSIRDDEQTATIFKDTRELAKVAVNQGNAILTQAEVMVNNVDPVNNGVKDVPTYFLNPVAVDKGNYETLLVDSGYYKPEQLA